VEKYPEGRLHIHRSSKVIGLSRQPTKNGKDMPVKLRWVVGDMDSHHYTVHDQAFDHVIFACHADQILPILTGELRQKGYAEPISAEPAAGLWSSLHIGASAEERDVFSCFQTTENSCYLHSDLRFMPRRRDTWSSWNYLIESAPSEKSHPAGVSLTYNMNILQHIPKKLYGDVLVTMNPKHPPAPELTQGEYVYNHPLYTVEAVRAQEKLENLQNKGGISYLGGWVPFDFVDSTHSRGLNPEPLPLDYVIRIVVLIILSFIRLGERILRLPGVALLVAVLTFLPSLTLDILENTGLFA